MRSSFSPASFFPSRRAAWASGLAVAALLTFLPGLKAQDTTTVPGTATSTNGTQTPAAATPAATDAQTSAPAQADATLSATPGQQPKKKGHITRDDRVQQTKDTKAELRKQQKYNPLVGKDATLPDKQLYDKALTESN